MPCVEVVAEEIRNEGAEADRAGDRDHPPGPCFAGGERELHHPHVEHSDCDQGRSPGNAVVDHEVDEASISDPFEVLARHVEVGEVMR